MNFSHLLEASLPPPKLSLVKKVREVASVEAIPLYLVGGTVRDVLLGRPMEDVDLVVEGDAETFTYAVAKRLSGSVVSRSQFATAKIKVDGVSLDVITARSEYYSRPGALPRIAHGTIGDDLARRDFSINAMAFPLHLGASGQLVDPFDGQMDLHHHLIRALHTQSFVHDATRIMRAVRYEQRLGFKMDEHTESMLRRDLPMLDTISGDRLQREIALWLKEKDFPSVLFRAKALGVLTAIHPPLGKATKELLDGANKVAKLALDVQVCLGLLAYPQTQSEGEGFIERLRLSPRWAVVVRDTIALKDKLPMFSKRNMPPAQIYDGLAHSNPLAVQACALMAKDEQATQNLTLFLEKLRYVKPHLGGRDIIDLGVVQGPAIGEMLVRLRYAHLAGVVNTRVEEETMVLEWLEVENWQG